VCGVRCVRRVRCRVHNRRGIHSRNTVTIPTTKKTNCTFSSTSYGPVRDPYHHTDPLVKGSPPPPAPPLMCRSTHPLVRSPEGVGRRRGPPGGSPGAGAGGLPAADGGGRGLQRRHCRLPHPRRRCAAPPPDRTARQDGLSAGPHGPSIRPLPY